MAYLLARALAALLLSAGLAGAEPVSIVGSWNCQARDGRAGIGRLVTYEANGAFIAHNTFQSRARVDGVWRTVRISFSVSGRWTARGNILAERIDKAHGMKISLDQLSQVIPFEEEDRLRREYVEAPHLRYRIRARSAGGMTMRYAAESPESASDGLLFTCSRVAAG